jgi:hypothetical protein
MALRARKHLASADIFDFSHVAGFEPTLSAVILCCLHFADRSSVVTLRLNDVGVKTLLLKAGAEIQLLVDYRRETARLTGDMVAEHILDEAAHHRAHF